MCEGESKIYVFISLTFEYNEYWPRQIKSPYLSQYCPAIYVVEDGVNNMGRRALNLSEQSTNPLVERWSSDKIEISCLIGGEAP